MITQTGPRIRNRCPSVGSAACHEWTRECLAIDVAGGIRSDRVIEVLAQLVTVRDASRLSDIF